VKHVSVAHAATEVTRTPSAVVPAVEVDGLTKHYGRHRGIEELSFRVEPGELFGFLGPNGAGKTTTIRLLLDLIRPTSGRASVLGLDSRRDAREVHRLVGYLPGELGLYEQLTGMQLLQFAAGVRGGVDWRYVTELIERLGLDPTRRIAELSKGNKQKVGIVQAFMHRPPLLILDEPTSGLDPLVQQAVYRLFDETTAEGRTIFLSSHVLSEVERVAHRVGIIREGRLATVADVADLKARARRRVDIQFGRALPTDAFAGVEGVASAQINGHVAHLVLEGAMGPVFQRASALDLVTVVTHEADLEDIFLSYYGTG
jgi:ABC-2 type transport system ATP-binding protein